MYPNLLHFGNLEVLEVYEFYDKPLLFSCRDPLGNYFLAVEIDEDATTERWLYVVMSPSRFHHVRSGGIDLREAFYQPETGVTYQVTVPLDTGLPAQVVSVLARDLPADSLPAPSEFLKVRTATLPAYRESLHDRARRQLRDLLALRLKLPEYLRTEAPAKLLGSVLTGVQDTVNSISLALRGGQARRGTLPREILSAGELVVVGFGDGSFEVMFAAAEPQAEMFEVRTDASAALESFIGLLEITPDADKLQERLKEQPRVAGSYLNLLRAMTQRIESVQAEWAAPQDGRLGMADVSAVAVKAAISVIEYEAPESHKTLEVLGRLVGANIEKKTFELWSIEEGNGQYAGRVADAALAAVDGAVIGSVYRAALGIELRLKPATGELQEVITLIALVFTG